MKKLLKSLTAVLNKPAKHEQAVCNYPDNYYGDQICTLIDS